MNDCLRRTVTRGIFAGIATISVTLASSASAQTATGGVSGSSLFATYCASCHGQSAKGNGPLASAMKTPPADLTLIAQRNKGVFPSADVARMIDGRSPLRGHGGGDMPVWGDTFAKSSAEQTPTSVEQKIQRLVSYLATLQAKP